MEHGISVVCKVIQDSRVRIYTYLDNELQTAMQEYDQKTEKGSWKLQFTIDSQEKCTNMDNLSSSMADDIDIRETANDLPCELASQTEHSTRTDSGSLNRGQFRQYQINTRHKQIKTELLVSLVLGGCLCIVFWQAAPTSILLIWLTATIALVGIRSLFVYRRIDEEKPEEVLAWGEHFTVLAALSGISWGSLGIITNIYGSPETHQFTILILECITLAAYILMQSSPQAIAAFVLPVLVPNGVWFLLYYDIPTQLLGVVTLLTALLMVMSSRAMRDVLLKSLNLSSHNTELIHKLVFARESAEKATQFAEKINAKLQHEIIVRQHAEEQLKASNQELTAILDNMQDIVFQIDLDGKFIWTTPSVHDVLGYSKKEVLGQDIKRYYLDENDLFYFKRELQENNGIQFERRVNQALDNTRTSRENYALCYVDLDNFKIINDTCGHMAGDELLRQLTTKLGTVVRESDAIARLGGDEFGILLSGCEIEWACNLAERIRVLLNEFRFVWDNKVYRIGGSIGIVGIGENSGNTSEVLRAADSACYVAKQNGGNRIHRYEDNDMELVEHQGQMQWVQKIHKSLEDNRFRLFFQKIEKLKRLSGEVDKIHGEVLLRLLDENNQLVGPTSFIPAAERYNLMPAIDRWVVENTLLFLAANIDKLIGRLDKCCINLSGQSLSDESLMSFVIEQIYNNKIPGNLLCFEITESAVIANLNTATRMIGKLRDMGCSFALDDFGVGLSSFAYLSNLAIDYLKVDGSFIKKMASSSTDLEMVRAINQIGHTMNVKTIAEYVENEEILQMVREIGIDYAQGYALSKPCALEIALFKNETEKAAIDSHQDNVSYMKTFSSDA